MVKSILLRDKCPDCQYPPRPQEKLFYWEAEMDSGTFYMAECPNCEERFIYAAKGDLLPPREKLLGIVEEAEDR